MKEESGEQRSWRRNQEEDRKHIKIHKANFSNVPETLHFLKVFIDLSASFSAPEDVIMSLSHYSSCSR